METGLFKKMMESNNKKRNEPNGRHTPPYHSRNHNNNRKLNTHSSNVPFFLAFQATMTDS